MTVAIHRLWGGLIIFIEIAVSDMHNTYVRMFNEESRNGHCSAQILTSYVSEMPGGPGGPGEPCMPGTPSRPGSPFFPCRPSGPGGPESPRSPRSPLGPLAPRSPETPVAPCNKKSALICCNGVLSNVVIALGYRPTSPSPSPLFEHIPDDCTFQLQICMYVCSYIVIICCRMNAFGN